MNNMGAELIGKLDSDDGVADAARVSMAKQASNFTSEENAKLMRYLAGAKHWSPYGHQRDIFRVSIEDEDWLKFLENAQLAGFSFYRGIDENLERERYVYLSGSLWAWYENLGWLPREVREDIIFALGVKYPVASKIFWPQGVTPEHIRGGYASLANHLPVSILTAGVHYLTFRLKGPISLARQLVKHQVHLCWNEESRRYIIEPVEFYQPELRARAPKIKQGSKDELIDRHELYDEDVRLHYQECAMLYERLLEANVAPECARNVLPIGSVTNWVWTGSLTAWHRVCRQRMDGHAQKEAQFVAGQINDAIAELYPDTWQELWQQYEL